jgi:hypothetical protein
VPEEAHRTVPEIISFPKITSQTWLSLLFNGSFKKFLANTVLPCDLFFRDTRASDAEESRRLNLASNI